MTRGEPIKNDPYVANQNRIASAKKFQTPGLSICTLKTPDELNGEILMFVKFLKNILIFSSRFYKPHRKHSLAVHATEWKKIDTSGNFTGGTEILNFLPVSPFPRHLTNSTE